MTQTKIVLTPWLGLVELLESEDFYCDAAVASSFQAFYRRIAEHAVTEQLSELVRADPETAGRVLSYAKALAESVAGSTRSEKDAALCACIVALRRTANPAVDDFLRYLRTTRELALRWASEIAEIVAQSRIETVRTETTWASLFSSTIALVQAGETRHPEERPSDAGVSRRTVAV